MVQSEFKKLQDSIIKNAINKEEWFGKMSGKRMMLLGIKYQNMTIVRLAHLRIDPNAKIIDMVKHTEQLSKELAFCQEYITTYADNLPVPPPPKKEKKPVEQVIIPIEVEKPMKQKIQLKIINKFQLLYRVI